MTVVEFLKRNPEIGLSVCDLNIKVSPAFGDCVLSIETADGTTAVAPMALCDIDSLIAALQAVKLAVQE